MNFYVCLSVCLLYLARRRRQTIIKKRSTHSERMKTQVKAGPHPKMSTGGIICLSCLKDFPCSLVV